MATHSFFSKVALGPKDPILGVSEAFVADADPRKINLGVGVYQNAQGKAEKLAVVQKVERKILDGDRSATYLPIDGLKEFGPLVQRLVFGSDHPLVASGAIATCQSIGGSGGLRVAADFLKQNLSIPEVWISDPTWDNHRAIFEIAGFKTHGYPWYDPKTLSFDEAAFLETLERIPAGSLVLLHGCCHNPTGIDPTPEQWKKIHGTIRFRGLVPLLDLAYQGLGEGRDADAFAVRLFSDGSIPCLVVSSYSKSFSLYSVRVGALSIVTSGAEEASRVMSQVKRVIRANYSSPPALGAKIVSSILGDPELFEEWDTELSSMRTRLKSMRALFSSTMQSLGVDRDMSFATRQIGMFSFSGLSREVARWLAAERHIYILENGRICMAALNEHNMEYVCTSIRDALKELPS